MSGNYRRKSKWKAVLSATLCVALLVGAIGGIVAITKRETKRIPASSFSLGALNADTGKYEPSKKAIYTKEMFKCQGLRVEPDFEAGCTYDVFYYDYDGRLLDKNLGLSEIYDEDFPLAEYARIVIHPEIPEDVDEDEFKIKFYEVLGIARKLTITVDREQKDKDGKSFNLYNDAAALQDTTISDDATAVGSVIETESCSGVKVSEQIALEDSFKYVDIYIRIKENKGASACALVVTSADKKVVYSTWYDASDLMAGEWCRFTVKLPEAEGEQSLFVRLPSDADCYIFGYNK